MNLHPVVAYHYFTRQGSYHKRIVGIHRFTALGMILPAVVILIVFATFFDDFRHFAAVDSFLRGARPAIVALIALPCFQLWRQSGITLSTVWIPVGAAIGIGLLGVSPTSSLPFNMPTSSSCGEAR